MAAILQRTSSAAAEQPLAAAVTSRDRYVGETKSQLRHGYGVYNYENRFFRYEGQWEDGLKHGHGKLVLGDGGHYEGTFVKGEIEGHGYRVFGVSGNIYTGQFLRGEPHGQGLMRTPAGEQYEGDFREGRREGFGTLTERDGACYEGEFHGNHRHGEGSQVYANGDQYNGDWVKGHRHGHGVLRCSDGTTYEGQWRGGVCHGEGTMTHCSGVSYSGMWVNGSPSGEAVAVKLGGEGGQVVVVQGERFNINFECVDANGSVATLESGRSFRVSAAIREKAVKPGQQEKRSSPEETETLIHTPYGYDAVQYELLQMPQSTDSSQRSSQTTPPTDPTAPPPPGPPLQLGRLTSELYRLHSSSTHSLSRVSRDSDTRRSSAGPHSTKSLQNLDSLTGNEDNILDSFTSPSLGITNGGKGSFRELFLPPPILPLPKIKDKLPRSSSRSLRERGEKSRAPTPGGGEGRESDSQHSLRSGSRQSVVESSGSLVGGTQVTASGQSFGEREEGRKEGEGEREEGRKEGEGEREEGRKEGEGERGGTLGVPSQSKVVKKLLQKRAKFCTPGAYVLTVMEVTSPPFLGRLLDPLHVEVHVVSQKKKTTKDSPLSNLIRHKSKPT